MERVERTTLADVRRRVPTFLFVIVLLILLITPHISIIKGSTVYGHYLIYTDGYPYPKPSISVSLVFGETVLIWIDVKTVQQHTYSRAFFIKQLTPNQNIVQKDLNRGFNVYWFIPIETGIYEIGCSSMLEFDLFVFGPLIFSVALILAYVIIYFSFRWIFHRLKIFENDISRHGFL